MKNTLLLGNGFNLSLYSNVPRWADLFKDEKEQEINNYTFLYEACLLKSKKQDDTYKEIIVKRFSDYIRIDNIHSEISDIDRLGKHLEEHQIGNLLTTNMDTGIETILTDINDYRQIDNDSSKEKIYSIRRRKTFINREGTHELNVWKIHGDVDTIPSVSFGFDQYCGSLSKIDDYVKGKYYSSDGKTKCIVPIKDKCDNATFDDISWIELFFTTNVYIACFGMDFSEIDIWWLLNKRCRFKNQGIPVSNKIVFLYSAFDTGETKEDEKEKEDMKKAFENKIYMLKALDVECRRIEADKDIITNIFDQIE